MFDLSGLAEFLDRLKGAVSREAKGFSPSRLSDYFAPHREEGRLMLDVLVAMFVIGPNLVKEFCGLVMEEIKDYEEEEKAEKFKEFKKLLQSAGSDSFSRLSALVGSLLVYDGDSPLTDQISALASLSSSLPKSCSREDSIAIFQTLSVLLRELSQYGKGEKLADQIANISHWVPVISRSLRETTPVAEE